VTAEMLHVGRADGVAVHEDDAPRFAPVDNGDGDRGK
jgi:hypothetical protein